LVLKLFRNRGRSIMVTMKAYIDEYGLDKNKVVYNPNAAPTEWTELPSLKEKFQICYIGGLSNPFYHHEIAIKAISILKDEFPNLKLILVGDGICKNDLTGLVKDLGVQEQVKFLGHVPFPEVNRIIRESMIGLALNPWLGQKEMEYAACGKPSIGVVGRKSLDPLPWIVYVEPNPSAVAEKIRDMIKKESSRRKLGKIGRGCIVKLFNWDHIADIWQENIEKIV